MDAETALAIEIDLRYVRGQLHLAHRWAGSPLAQDAIKRATDALERIACAIEETKVMTRETE